MLRLLSNAQSSMAAQQEKLDAISNNIANANTNGYKKVDANFKDLVYETLDRNGYPVSTKAAGNAALQNGTGVRVGEWKRDSTQGQLTQSSLSTDLALDGPGYFEVTQPDNSKAYTRSGNFQIDANGTIVDDKGNRLSILDGKGNNINRLNGPYKFNKNNFKVDAFGNISIKQGNSSISVGKIKISDAIGDNSMISIGDSLFTPKPGVTMVQSKNYSVMQGYIEQSNVDVATEMSEMLVTQRAFQLSSTTLKTADEMWQMANNLQK